MILLRSAVEQLSSVQFSFWFYLRQHFGSGFELCQFDIAKKTMRHTNGEFVESCHYTLKNEDNMHNFKVKDWWEHQTIWKNHSNQLSGTILGELDTHHHLSSDWEKKILLSMSHFNKLLLQIYCILFWVWCSYNFLYE